MGRGGKAEGGGSKAEGGDGGKYSRAAARRAPTYPRGAAVERPARPEPVPRRRRREEGSRARRDGKENGGGGAGSRRGFVVVVVGAVVVVAAVADQLRLTVERVCFL